MFDKSVILIVVSREILEGTVVDRNAAFIANRIDDLGYRVRTIQVVDRVESEMVGALVWALEQKPSFVLMTGGMGPNWDDNARNVAGKATGLPLVEDQRALDYVRSSYRRMHAKGLIDDAELTEERVRMARVPKGSVCHENPIGTAPAVQLRHGSTSIFLLPGVPAEMQRLFTLHVMPAMVAEGPNTVRAERQVDYHGHDESAISKALGEIVKAHPQVSFRTRVQGTEEGRTIRITLVSENEDAVALSELLDRAEVGLRDALGIEVHGRPTDAGRIGD